MKILRIILISVLSLAVVFALGCVFHAVTMSLGLPVAYKDLHIVSQDYHDGQYTVTVSPEAGALYCNGCSFSVEDGKLYVTVTGNVSATGERDITFTYRCDGITEVDYRYKKTSSLLFTVLTERD